MAKRENKSDKAPIQVNVRVGMRRHNRSNGRGTISQDHAHSRPKWDVVDGTGGRVLVRRGGGLHSPISNPIVRGKDNKWESLCNDKLFSYIKPPTEPESKPIVEEAAAQ